MGDDYSGLLLFIFITTIVDIQMPVPSQGHYGFHSYPVVD